MIPVLVIVRSETLRAMPKSVSFTWPSHADEHVAGLDVPVRDADLVRGGEPGGDRVADRGRGRGLGSGPSTCSSSARLCAGMYSVTTNGSPSSRATSCRVITFGWDSAAIARASRSVRSRSSSASLSGMPGGSRTSLTATGRRRNSS